MSSDNKNKTQKNFYSEIKEWARAFIICLAFVIVFRGILFSTFIVKGPSMEPTFYHSDIVLVSKTSYLFGEPKQGDIIVCNSDYGKGEERIIKRVIGLPGDIIDLQFDGSEYILTVNGDEIEETYLTEPIMQQGDTEYPYTVEESSYFVMGDNRNVSTDSRAKIIGAIPKKDIIGKVLLRFYPLNKIKTF